MIRPAVTLFLLTVSAEIGAAAEFRTGQPVMGTVLEITVIAEDPGRARLAAETALATVRRWDDVLTTWRPDGELWKLNEAAGRGTVAVSAELHRALTQMVTLTARTGGAFDPSVGPLVDAWRAQEAPPADVRGGGVIGIADVLTLAPEKAGLAAGAALDAGAVGKGIGLDAAVQVLRVAGIEAAFLDFGNSTQVAIGAPPESPAGWPVAVSGLAEGRVAGVVKLRDAALSTSRSIPPGAAEGVIIDPRTRAPVVEPRVVTVRTTRASDADAWSTALVVLGRAGLPRARQAGVEVFFEDAEGPVQAPVFVQLPGK